jgi:tetratricopeptide (TPR) repeat protein
MIKQVFFFIIFSTLTLRAFAQTDAYHQLKIQYDSLRKAENHNGALLVAKQMNTWALQNETDTSLRYAVSLRYIGNSHETLGNTDSTIYYWTKSVVLFEKHHPKIPDYISIINNLGILYSELGDYKVAEPYFKQALEIRKKTLGDEHPDVASSLNNLGVLCSNIGDYQSAESFYKQSLAIKKKVFGEKHPDLVLSLDNLGQLFSDIGDYKSAEPYYKQSLAILKNILGVKHTDYGGGLMRLGILYYNMGDYQVAEPYFKQTLEIYKQNLGEEHPDYAMTLNNLGNLFSDMGDYKTAEPYYKQSIEIYKHSLGEEHPDFAMSLNNLGLLYSDMGDYKAAEPYYKQALEIRKQALGVDHSDYAGSLNNLGNLYSDMGDYKAAESYYKQAFDIKKQALGEEHPDYAVSLMNLGTLYSDMGDYKAAEPYYKQALDIKKQALGEEHPDYADALMNLGALYSDMGDILSAEPLCKQSAEIYKKAFGEMHPDFASSLNNLGTVFAKMGDYQYAEQYYKQSLEIRKQALGEEHPDYGGGLMSLGLLYFDMGDYQSAELLFKQFLNIYKKVLGDEHPDYAVGLMSLGSLYFTMGNYHSAEPLYKQSLAIKKNIFGEEHPDVARSLNNLGMLYSNMGDYQTAEPLFKQSLAIRKNIFGDEHPEVARSLMSIAVFYSEMDDYQSAEPFYKQSLEIYKKALGDEHPEYADGLMNLGSLFSNMGDYKAAEPYYQQALEIRKQALGEEHPDYLSSLNNLGTMYSEMSDYEPAASFYKLCLHQKLKLLYSNFSWLLEFEKSAYWQQEKDFYEIMNSFSVSAVDSVLSCTELSYNANIISKSLLLETSRELDQAISQSSDQDLKAQFAEMKQLRKLYSKMQSEGSTNKEVMEHCKIQADSLDKILVNKIGEYAASKRKFEITWKDIQSSLTSTDAAIEFARYYDEKDSLYKYMALVVRPDYEYPKLVTLGEEDAIRTAVQNKDLSTLYNEAWKGIDSLLVGVKRVYFSPSGEINNISFSALCIEEGNELVAANNQKNRGVVTGNNNTPTKACNAVLMDKYELHQLTTTRFLADGTLTKEKPMQPSLALVGGINFDDIPDKTNEAEKEQSNEDLAFHANLNKRSASTNGKKRGKRSSSNYGKRMEPLPGTKEEVENIAGLPNITNWKVQTKSDKKAGEYEFKKELETKAPGVLHIATHGFAFPDEAKKESKLIDENQMSTYKASEDPMVRCGLMLGGSNISWTGNPQKMIEKTGDDGILTAAEVANLDLSNTKLVVLSACETGLGKIEGSEGTFGLKRGFKLAGVEQMIVSLWSVPDKETMELMTLFYSDLTKTLNPVTSFEKAQKEMRNKYPTEPEKWAGFVLVR